MMFYQVNTFDYTIFNECESAPVMITTEIDKAIAKGNELVDAGNNTEIVTWKSETELDNVACIFYGENVPSEFVNNGNETVIEREIEPSRSKTGEIPKVYVRG